MASNKKSSALLFSIGGIIAVAVILILVNYIFGAFRARIDLTEDNLYTLSDGTRKILSEVDTPVKIRYYVTQDKKILPQYLQTYIPKVEDLLTEYEKRSNDGLVEVERMDPEPDSDDEIAANQAGISAANTPSGYAIYNGIEVQSLDQKAIIPFLDPREEKTLEYELSRAITEVSRSEKPEIWIMTEQSLTGQPINPMMAMQGGGGQQPPWFLYQTLQRDYDVKTVGVATDVIDSSVDLLMVLHPNGITETAEYAIDQYVLGGGKVIAMLDPNFYMGAGANPMGGGATTTSTFNKLLGAWGIEFSDGKAVADMKFRTALQGQRGQRELEPRVLTLNAEAVNDDDVSTNALQSLMYIFGGAFSGSPTAGLEKVRLFSSSANSELADKGSMPGANQQVAANFKGGDKELDLAIRLTGKFTTAFPDGKPAAPDAGEEGEEKPPEPEDDAEQLKESVKDSAVVLIGDVDMFHDNAYVQRMNFMGQQAMSMRNHNLIFLQNLVEQLAGDSNLITVRSRASATRNFTKIAEMEAEANDRYQSTIKSLEDELTETNERLAEKQRTGQGRPDGNLISPEMEAEIRSFRQKQGEIREKLRKERRNLREDIESLQNRLKFGNILGMPILIVLIGLALAFIRKSKTAAR